MSAWPLICYALGVVVVCGVAWAKVGLAFSAMVTVFTVLHGIGGVLLAYQAIDPRPPLVRRHLREAHRTGHEDGRRR